MFPACYVEFPENAEGRSAAFFLAAEEFLAREMPADDYAFFWQLRPTVVFGRHQDPTVELDIPFCKSHGVELIRRKSGGGTIFADEDNIMVSLVTETGSVEDIFAKFAHTVAGSLRSMGVPTKVSGRNDICLDDGRKICGGAFYHLPGRSIVHCTMLYDTQMELMRGCLTPGRAKLQSKGVKSVESRIGLLREFLSCGASKLRERLRPSLCDRMLRLTPEQMRRIEELERPYHEETYIYGKRRAEHNAEMRTRTFSERIEGCGRIDLVLHANADGIITDVHLGGDFFESGSQSAEEAFRTALTGMPMTSETIHNAISLHHPERTIHGLRAEDFKNTFSHGAR